MKQIEHDNCAFFDVDDTLIMYSYPLYEQDKAIEIKIDDDHPSVWVVPHEKHIEAVRNHKAWGNGVVVWSRSGYKWAAAVVKALDLELYVDVVMAKPFYYYDDKKCCDILGEHRYKTP